MCGIVIMEPGETPPYEPMANMIYNNSHGYGLVLRDPKEKRLEVIKKTPEENDPKEIYDLLKEHEDVQRFLHVRNKTEGEISPENQHPFCSYHSNKRQVYFMHNGTLHDYAPKGTTYGQAPVVVQKESDSKRFNDEVIGPLLLKLKGEEGYGDIDDSTFLTIIHKFWGYADNKGLLISNDQGYALIAPEKWKRKKFDGMDTEFLVSNDSYFTNVTRGPEYERRKAAEAKKKTVTTPTYGSTTKRGMTSLRDVTFLNDFKLKDNLKDVFSDGNLYSEKGMAAFALLTPKEILDFTKEDPSLASNFFQYITTEFYELQERYERIKKYVESHESNKVG